MTVSWGLQFRILMDRSLRDCLLVFVRSEVSGVSLVEADSLFFSFLRSRAALWVGEEYFVENREAAAAACAA